MKNIFFMLLTILLFAGCKQQCCNNCYDNACKCNGNREKCLCPTGYCSCRFVVSKKDDKKYEYIRKNLPKFMSSGYHLIDD